MVVVGLVQGAGNVGSTFVFPMLRALLPLALLVTMGVTWYVGRHKASGPPRASKASKQVWKEGDTPELTLSEEELREFHEGLKNWQTTRDEIQRGG